MDGKETRRCHVVAMPYPGRGHINIMMNLCELLAARANNIVITFVVTQEWLGLLDSQSTAASIRFGTIPNCIPSERGRAADMLGFIDAVRTKTEEHLELLLDRLDPPPSIIVADSYLASAVIVGNRRNIPVASVWPMSASMYAVLHHFDLLRQNGHFPADLTEVGNEVVDYIPGMTPTRISDLPTIFSDRDQLVLFRALEILSWLPKAQYLLFSTIYEIEAPVVDSLRDRFSFPVYHVGPLIPYFKLVDDSSMKTNPRKGLDYLQWLDLQPKNSVLYVSFGSFLSVSNAQMDEIVAGLRDSGVRYMWVVRDDHVSGFKEGLGAGGLRVPWCDQLRVLCHASVGGFWTHCGWNSTLEAMFGGVPMLTFPIAWDQFPNSKLIVEDWKIGWRLKKQEGVEKLIKREEIAGIVQRFMDVESIEVQEMRTRARELGDICGRAIRNNGSSENDMGGFIRDILGEH